MDTLEEMQRKLKELGVKLGEWEDHEERDVTPGIVGRHKGMLLQMKELVEGQIAKDQKVLGQLHEARARHEHGGAVKRG
jgi:hypothetical protein